jgi:hypothetical protein
MGIPKDSVLAYETAVREDGFLVLARGTSEEVARAKEILQTIEPTRIDVHQGATAAEPAGPLVNAVA